MNETSNRATAMNQSELVDINTAGGVLVDLDTGTILGVGNLVHVLNIDPAEQHLEDEDVLLYAKRHGQPVFVQSR